MSFLYTKRKEDDKMKIYPNVSTKISKLGEGIATVNLPAVVTCRCDAPCAEQCYARKGNFCYSTVKNGLQKNLEAYLENPDRFFDVINYQLKMIPYRFFRWHSSGDIVDKRYLEGMVWLAEQHPNTRFLCFTKKYEIVNDFLNEKEKPENLILVLSNWKDWQCENLHGLPTSWVRFPKEEYYIPENANECPGYCGECVNTSSSCWSLKYGESVCFKKH